jgi:hypothetical protein
MMVSRAGVAVCVAAVVGWATVARAAVVSNYETTPPGI